MVPTCLCSTRLVQCVTRSGFLTRHVACCIFSPPSCLRPSIIHHHDTLFFLLGLHSHRIRQCNETRQGCAPIVQQGALMSDRRDVTGSCSVTQGWGCGGVLTENDWETRFRRIQCEHSSTLSSLCPLLPPCGRVWQQHPNMVDVLFCFVFFLFVGCPK